MRWPTDHGNERIAARGERKRVRRSRFARSARTAGFALAGLASTLQLATAAPPASYGSTSTPTLVRHSSGLPQSASEGWSPSAYAAAPGCACTSCGKKRKPSWVRTLLDHVTAGTDRLIFGSSPMDYCDTDSGCDSACDSMGPYGSVEIPSGQPFYPAPVPAPPTLESLPGPAHRSAPPEQTPVSRPLRDVHPATPLMLGPVPGVPGDQLRDPFGDDPIYQGSNPEISRSAYYE